MESVRRLTEENGGISMLSPQIGGGTSNVEYEFLTGKNVIYFPPSAIVYQQFITQKEWSLAWYFRDYGYATTAIHPYHDWFWKRNLVYPLFGFENIYFNDGTLNYIDVKGGYISDKAVSDEIISRYNMFAEDGERPVFTFAVTMQNHGPYYPRYFGDDAQIQLINKLDPSPEGIAESFAEGVRYSSEAFAYLTEYFKDVDRPTYIIMFGDHAPSAVPDIRDFYAINENGDISADDIYNMYKTPLLVWTNQNNPETAEKIRSIGTVTPQMLTEEIFSVTGMPKPAYIQMLSKIKETTRGFTSRYTLDGNGGLIGADPANLPQNQELIKSLYDKLNVVQYDATVGKQYFISDFTE
jgi:phosphoglycerol transferase MdoB-like AlkP superfamily enzyme